MTLVALPVFDPDATAGASSHRPLAVIVVGPVSGMTSLYLRDARKIATQLRSYGARVREVYTPRATWARVKEAARGANLFVYMGHGNGYPSPYGRFNPERMNGLGLNAVSGHGNSNKRYYGEDYLRRSLHLAPGAIVILNHVCYAAGSSEPGRVYPVRRLAVSRADNFAAGFLGAGAAVVFASDRSVTSIIRDLFGAHRTMRAIFWRSPWTSTRRDTVFSSARTPGRAGILAPYGPGRYFQSVIGRLGWTTADWRATWNPPTLPPAPPTPSAAPSASPSPSADPSTSGDPVTDPSATPVAEAAATPAAEPTPEATAESESATTPPEPTPEPAPEQRPEPAPEQTPEPPPAP